MDGMISIVFGTRVDSLLAIHAGRATRPMGRCFADAMSDQTLASAIVF